MTLHISSSRGLIGPSTSLSLGTTTGTTGTGEVSVFTSPVTTDYLWDVQFLCNWEWHINFTDGTTSSTIAQAASWSWPDDNPGFQIEGAFLNSTGSPAGANPNWFGPSSSTTTTTKGGFQSAAALPGSGPVTFDAFPAQGWFRGKVRLGPNEVFSLFLRTRNKIVLGTGGAVTTNELLYGIQWHAMGVQNP